MRAGGVYHWAVRNSFITFITADVWYPQANVSFSLLGFNNSDARVSRINVVTIYLCKLALIHEFLPEFYLYFTLSQAWNCLIFFSWVLLYLLSKFRMMQRYFIDYITSTSACAYFSCFASQRLLNLHDWEKEKGRKRTSSNQSPGRTHNGAATREDILIWMKGRKKRLNNTKLTEQKKNRNRIQWRLSKEHRWLAS